MNRVGTRLWAGLFVLVVFSAGLAAGFALRPWLDPGPPRGFRGRGEPPPPSARTTERLLDRLGAHVDLSDDQRRRLHGVFEARRLRFREITAGVRERFEAEQAQMDAEIADILTAEQMEVFESRIVRMRRGRRGRFGPRGPDDGGRPAVDLPARPPR